MRQSLLKKRLLDAKLLWRDWRGGQLNLIVTALLLAVMVVTAVSLLADRVERGLTNQISSFLAADLALRGRVPITQKYRQQASQLGLQTAEVAEFQSMVFKDDKNHLASLKVVQENYPLRGSIELVNAFDGNNVVKLSRGPEQGEVWVEPRLLGLLDATVGDHLEIGYTSLIISALIVNEPDRGAGFTSSGARVIMSQEDLASSQLIRPGSRVRYKLLMSGSEPDIQRYQQWYKQEHQLQEQDGGIERRQGGQRTKSASHYRLVTPENSEQRLGQALQRGRTFLLLSSMIGVLLSGLAMALASHRYAARATDQVALMKAWGQSSRDIRISQFSRLMLMAFIATLIGMFLGWLAHFILMEIAQGLFDAQLPSASWRPWLVSGLTGYICMIGFALPALWHLPSIAPLKVLRRDLPDSLVSQSLRLVIGVGALMVLTVWYSQSIVLSLMFLGVLFALFSVCALIAFQLLRLLQRFGHWRGSYVRLGLANLWRRRTQSMVQLLSFAITLMLLLTVTGLRTNLVAQWQAQLPDDAPSHFIYNVSNAEIDQVKALFSKQQLPESRWYPMVLGRLVGINGEVISLERLNQSRGLSREVNLTQATNLPSANTIVAGQWWDNGVQAASKKSSVIGQAQFSIEEEVANEIGLILGDNVEFSIGGITFSATLTSFRRVDWQSMNVNFYVIFSPGTLDHFAPNWVTSVSARVSSSDSVLPEQAPFVGEMVTHFPTSVVLEVRSIIDRIRNVITRVTQGLELIMLLVLACGAMVLFASIAVSHDERLKESAILRTLGCSRRVILGALAVEYAMLGFIAGLLASGGAEFVLYFIQVHLMGLAPNLHPMLWLIGLFAGVLLITSLGMLRSKSLVTVPPLQSLKQIA